MSYPAVLSLSKGIVNENDLSGRYTMLSVSVSSSLSAAYSQSESFISIVSPILYSYSYTTSIFSPSDLSLISPFTSLILRYIMIITPSSCIHILYHNKNVLSSDTPKVIFLTIYICTYVHGKKILTKHIQRSIIKYS